ncbi:MAG: hypothetical protein U1E76_03445 [Planctomycetota bacterium]
MPTRKSMSAVLLGIGVTLIALGGVVGPVMKEQRAATERAAAMADLADIGKVVDAVLKRKPALARDAQGEALSYVHTEGKLPSNNVYASGPGAPLLEWFRAANAPLIGADPWGHAYLVNLHSEGGSLSVLSAGPNGQVNTEPNAILPGGDDLLYVLD